MTPSELGLTQQEVDMLQQQAETSFPIVDLYSELLRCIALIPVEDNSQITSVELKAAVQASRDISIKTGMIPRYDVFHNVFEFVRIRLDASLRSKSVLLYQWTMKYKSIVPMYDYKGLV